MNYQKVLEEINEEIKPFLNDKQTLYSTRHWFVTELLRNDISENIDPGFNVPQYCKSIFRRL